MPFWNAKVRASRETVVRAAFDAPEGTVIRLGGVELVNGRRVRMAYGLYDLTVETPVGDAPAADAAVRLRLLDSDDPAAERARWRGLAKADRDILERAAALFPGTPLGRRAAEALTW